MRKRLDDDYDKRNISLIAIPNLPTFAMAIKSPPAAITFSQQSMNQYVFLTNNRNRRHALNSLDCLDPMIRDTLCCDHFADIFIVIICVINGDSYCYKDI